MLSVVITLTVLLGLFNSPNPRFEAQIIDDKISIGYGLATGDVDGDAKPDILLADKKSFVWYRNGDWKKFVMIENLTEHDNVCIAARDINGDGKVEVAVGAQWNPGETSNAEQSGSVHFLMRPDDPTQPWKAVRLHHEPTVHRMRWINEGGKYYLAVLPLHGRGNKNGEGEEVKLLLYAYPEMTLSPQPAYVIGTGMHMTHNLDVLETGDEKNKGLYVAGKEGIKFLPKGFIKRNKATLQNLPGLDTGTGEVRAGKGIANKNLIAAIEPMHGDKVTVYLRNGNWKRTVLDTAVKEGHAVAVADFLGTGTDQVVAGWRAPNKDGKTGIRLYERKNASATEWEMHWIDENGIACEDIQVTDLNRDGKPDIIASGRSTRNLKIYWNKSGQ